MVTIEIKLTTEAFGGCPWSSAGNEGKTEVIPSPVRIIRSLLSAFYQQSYINTNEFDCLTPEQAEVITKLACIDPSYYIPQYSHSGVITYHPDYATSLRNIVVEGKESQSSSRINFDPQINFSKDDSSIFVFYKTTLTAPQKDLLADALQYLTYLGRSEYGAHWKLLVRGTKTKPNCFKNDWGEVVETVNKDCENLVELLSKSPEQLKEDGYRMPPFLSMGFYALNAVRDVKAKQSTNSHGQIAYLQIDPNSKLHRSNITRLTNVLHKYLVKATEHNQAIGYGDDFDKDDKLYYLIDINSDDFITGIRITCKNPIEDSIHYAIKNLNHLIVNDEKIATRCLGVVKRYPNKSNRYKTIGFAVPHLEVRNNQLKRTAEGIFIKNTIQQAYGVNECINHEKKGIFLEALISDELGSIRCKATELGKSIIPFRGNRNAASSQCFNVIIELDNEVDLISIGAHCFFGLGELEPF